MFYCQNHPILQKAVGSEMRIKQVAYKMKDESSETLSKRFFFPPQLEVLKVRALFFFSHLMLIGFWY